jgi:Tfp pilus assembly protein PilF
MKKLRVFFRAALIPLLLVGCAPQETGDSGELAAAKYQLGVAYFEAGNYRAAVPELSKAAELAPANVEYRNALGMALLFNRKIDPAIKVFEEAIGVDPKNTEVKNNLASAYIMKGELEKAKPLLKQVLDDPLYPTPQFAYFNLARIYERQGKIDEAIEQYELALDIRPEYVDARYNLGMLYLQQGKTNRAIEQFTAATRLNPKIAVYQQSLGLAYVRAGKYQEARIAFQRVLEIEPNSPSAEYARRMLEELKQ